MAPELLWPRMRPKKKDDQRIAPTPKRILRGTRRLKSGTEEVRQKAYICVKVTARIRMLPNMANECTTPLSYESRNPV
jgi:hypothetical protein